MELTWNRCGTWWHSCSVLLPSSDCWWCLPAVCLSFLSQGLRCVCCALGTESPGTASPEWPGRMGGVEASPQEASSQEVHLCLSEESRVPDCHGSDSSRWSLSQGPGAECKVGWILHRGWLAQGLDLKLLHHCWWECMLGRSPLWGCEGRRGQDNGELPALQDFPSWVSDTHGWQDPSQNTVPLKTAFKPVFCPPVRGSQLNPWLCDNKLGRRSTPLLLPPKTDTCSKSTILWFSQLWDFWTAFITLPPMASSFASTFSEWDQVFSG